MNISGIGLAVDKNRKDKSVLKYLRRADDFSKMAVFAAYDAFVDSGLNEDAKNNLGLILATAFGPHLTTFRFLDEILDYGDANVSPTLFSHSVHNAANAYISINLGIYGPALTLTDFRRSFYQALLTAQSWLDEKRCENILVGSVEQHGKELDYVLSEAAPELAFKEGSVFFLVSSKKQPKEYSSLNPIAYQDEFISGFRLAANLIKDKK
ncbi:MAG: beta-ketoacyl synthase chain length factor [Candidatus Omnitrophota bacterium]